MTDATDATPHDDAASTNLDVPDLAPGDRAEVAGVLGDDGAGTGEVAADDPTASSTTFVVVEVVNVAFELPSPHPVVHLLEQSSPFRGIDFPIGLPEAQSIALALEGERPPRPSTHDLVVAVMAAAGCEVVAVRLTAEQNGTILGELDVMGPRGHEVLDCRPSDGIAIALRLAVPAPILCEVDLLDR